MMALLIMMFHSFPPHYPEAPSGISSPSQSSRLVLDFLSDFLHENACKCELSLLRCQAINFVPYGRGGYSQGSGYGWLDIIIF